MSSYKKIIKDKESGESNQEQEREGPSEKDDGGSQWEGKRQAEWESMFFIYFLFLIKIRLLGPVTSEIKSNIPRWHHKLVEGVVGKQEEEKFRILNLSSTA